MRATAAAVLFFTLTLPIAGAPRRAVVSNWSVPFMNPGTNAAISGRATFVAVDPCRIVDTRGAAGAFGGPFFSAGQTRTYNLTAGPCTGIPVAAAYSLNFTLVNYDASLGASGFVTAFPAGGTRPNVSTVNFGNGANAVANAAIVPANAGSISVYSSGATHLIVDINGYFIEPALTGVTAGTGISVTGTGNVTVGINTTGATNGQVLTFNGATTTWAAPAGDITEVIAGPGLTGGATTGAATLSVAFGGSGSATTVARSDHSHYVQTIIVSPAATAVSSGTALLNAVNGIIDASATKPYLVKIEPGVFDLGAGNLVMKPYVDVEGSGESVTRITAQTRNAFEGTVNMADHSELRFLSVESTGGSGDVAIGVWATSGAPRVTRVSINASGPVSNSYGIYTVTSAPVISDVTITAIGGLNACLGLLMGPDSAALVTNTRATCSGRTVGPATNIVFGFYSVSNSSLTAVPEVRDSTATATGGNTATGFRVFSAPARLSNVTARGSGGAVNSFGLETTGTGPFTVVVDRSTLIGSSATISGTTGFTIRVGASKLDGGAVVPNGGTVTCAGVYDEAYAFSAGPACP